MVGVILLIGCSTKKNATSNRVYESSSTSLQYSTQEKTEESTSGEENRIDYSGKIIAFTLVSVDSNSNTNPGLKYQYNLEAIDPITGASNILKEFVIFIKAKSMEDKSTLQGATFSENTLSNRACFDSDFSKIVYSEQFADGSIHVGWMDSEGTKTDITELLVNRNSFSDSVPKHHNPRFINDSFYFTDATSDDNKVMYVPVDNVSTENLSEFMPPKIEIKNDSSHDIYPSVDGGYINYKTSHGSANNFITDTISEIHSGGSQASGNFHSWLDETHFLDSSMNSINTKNDEKISLLPDNSRENISLIASSDGKDILFSSRLGKDDSETYIISTEGGEPRRLDDYKLAPVTKARDRLRYFLQWDVR